MGNQARRNYVSQKYTGLTTSYVEVTGTMESYLSVYVATEGLLLSIGHATPVDATAVQVPAGGAFNLPTGVIGPVHMRSLTGVSTDAHVVSA